MIRRILDTHLLMKELKEFNSKLHKSERRCFKCDSPTHIAVNCPLRRNKVGNVASNSYPRKGSNSPVRGRSRSLSPSPRVLFSDTEYDRSRNRVRNDNRDKDQRSDEFANCGACTSFHDSIVNVKCYRCCASNNYILWYKDVKYAYY